MVCVNLGPFEMSLLEVYSLNFKGCPLRGVPLGVALRQYLINFVYTAVKNPFNRCHPYNSIVVAHNVKKAIWSWYHTLVYDLL